MKQKFLWSSFFKTQSGTDTEIKTAHQMFLGTLFVGTLWSSLLTLTFLFQEHKIPQALSGLFFVTMILSLLHFLWTKNYRIGAHLQSISFYFYMVGLMIVTGGIASPAMIWLPLIIYYIYQLLGKKWALFWVTLWTLTNLIFWKANFMGLLPASSFTNDDGQLYSALSLIFMLPLGFWLYSIHRKAFDHLREINHKQRLESSHLLHVISHDLRSPLQIIQSYAQLLQEDSGEKKKEFLNNISKSVQRMADLINQVRDYEQLIFSQKSIPLEPVDLIKVIEENIATKQLHFSSKAIRVTLDFKEPSYTVLANRGALWEHVLCNIIANSFKFTHAKGLIEISAYQEKDKVILKIRDYGVGMPKELTTNAFEFSKKPSRPGTAGEKGSGLGLPIAKMFSDKMGILFDLKSWNEEEPTEKPGTQITLTFDAIKV